MEEVIAAPGTSVELKNQLTAIGLSREYARGLGLSVKGQYTDYVPWPQDRIITSLVVTEPQSVEARPFTYLWVGELPYKGFFEAGRAENEAKSFRDQGYDVCLVPVPAYSTLGFFADPITDPMLRGGEGPAVETVLHEFVHATVFVDNDADLNESAASFVGEEASVAFFADDPEKASRRRREVAEKRQIRMRILGFRQRVASLYEASGSQDASGQRAQLEAAFRDSIRSLPLTTRDSARVAERLRLNDACLALASTYSADLPEHQRVLEQLGGSLPDFIARLKGVANTDDPRAAFFGPESPVPSATTE